MEIVRQQIDNIDAVVKVKVEKEDYAERVEKEIKRYKNKGINVPGFRKGHYPIEMVRRQYGPAIKANVVNDILQEKLAEFVKEQNIILFTNMQMKDTEVDWKKDELEFEFDMEIIPEIDIDLKKGEPVRYYQIKTEDELIDQAIEKHKKTVATLQQEETVTQESQIEVEFFNQVAEIDKKAEVSAEELTPEAFEKIKGKKVGFQVDINSKKLFKDQHSLMHKLGLPHDVAHNIDVDITLTIQQINKRVLPQENEEFYKAMFPKEDISTKEQAREKIRQIQEKHFVEHSDKQFYNDVYKHINQVVDLEIPDEFLKKVIERSGAKKEVLEEEINNPIKKKQNQDYLRYQMVERRIIQQNAIEVSYQDIKDNFKKEMERYSEAYGVNFELDDQKIDSILRERLKDEAEYNRTIQTILEEKVLAFYRENLKLDTKEIAFNEFVKEMNKINGIEAEDNKQ